MIKIVKYTKERLLKNTKLLDTLFEVDRECFKVFYSHVEDFSFKNYIEKMRNADIYIVKEKEVLGSMIIEVKQKSIIIRNIALKEKTRGKGIGSILIKKAIKYKKDIFLSVRSSNVKAIKLYEKFGFKKIEVKKGGCFEGNSIIMKRSKGKL